MAASDRYTDLSEQPATPRGGRSGSTPVYIPPDIIASDKMPPDAVSDVYIEAGKDEEAPDLTDRALEGAPPWLISAVVHMTLLIILALVFVVISPRQRVPLQVTATFAEQLGEQLEFDSPLGIEPLESIEVPVLAPETLPEVEDPFAAPPVLDLTPDGTAVTINVDTPQIGLALSGRQKGTKRALLGRYGGTATTEAAVKRGLYWLDRVQLRDGSWSLAGPYDGAVAEKLDNRSAATAMALLAFQGAGNTHREGTFRRNVVRGWRWLLKQQDADGNFFHLGPHHHRYYTQAQCTIAICELYGMTKDPKYEKPAQLAVQCCLDAQSERGGWRYEPRTDSDTSVTGWVVMALQSSRMAGIDVPGESLDRVSAYLDKISRNDGSRYPYQLGHETTLAMTAEAILMRQYLGWPRDHPAMVDAMVWITSSENLINYERSRDAYCWYYATQAAHHMEGEYWQRWNRVMRQVVPQQQVRQGRETGSWDPSKPMMDRWAPHGGRLYVTCLSLYMLEVYYRHLPIYSKLYTTTR